MKRLLTHKGYDVFVRPGGGELYAHIERPGRRMAIADIPTVSAEAGEAAVLPLARAAIERDLRERG